MNIIRELQFNLRKSLPIVNQTEAAECGLACLSMISCYYGFKVNLRELRKEFQISLKGSTLANLTEIARELNLESRALRLDLEEIKLLRTPAILHWNLNHFVVLKSANEKFIFIHDPAVGERKLSIKEVSKHFTGIALELSPTLNFQRKKISQPIQLRQLVGKISGLKRGLLQILGLAIVLEIFSVLSPLITQWITDEAIVSSDRNILSLLCFGMIAIGICSTAITAARSWAGVYLSTNFSMQWMSNIMGHLLRLPVGYFERRHIGDIVSRFGAVESIQHGMTSAVIDVFLDGLLAIGTLIMMALYSIRLASISIAAIFFYAFIRWLRYDSLKNNSNGALVKKAKEQSYFLETIRGVRTIKLANKENERRYEWLNLWIEYTNATIVTQKLSLLFSSAWSTISTLERGCIYWLGAQSVIDHQMSLGMLFAFITYKEQFSGRVNTLVDRVVEFSMLSISTERLADIVLSNTEERKRIINVEIPNSCSINFENVSFKYAKSDHAILKNVSFIINPGECIAIVGPSGSGKTTLLKLLLGIHSPDSGKIKIGGLTIDDVGLSAYRSIVSTVMQDDQLFAGSVQDNIAFMEASVDKDWLIECAKSACIHDEISTMPMGYYSLVGDMGTTLSGGQKQRILLARALYRRPSILVLDEATSHLDLENEFKISDAIARLNISRIMIAHRPQTIAIADRIIILEDGKINEKINSFI